MATFAVLVEFEIPDDTDFTVAVAPLMDAVRALTPVPPTNVTAFAREAAEHMIEAGKCCP